MDTIHTSDLRLQCLALLLERALQNEQTLEQVASLMASYNKLSTQDLVKIIME